MSEHGLGGLIEKQVDARDYTPDLLGVKVLPMIPNDWYFAPPTKRDQNGWLMCGGFTGAEILEINHRTEFNEVIPYSAGFPYAMSCYKQPSVYEAMAGTDVCKVLTTYGGVPDSVFPYLGCKKDLLSKITDEIIEAGKPSKAMSWIRIFRHNLESKPKPIPSMSLEMFMATMLATKSPCICVMAIYQENFMAYAREHGGMVTYYQPGMTWRGEHVMTCLGWRTINGKKYFVLTTHWGDYGDHGLIYVPFDYNAQILMYSVSDYIERPFRCTAVYDQEKVIKCECIDAKNLKKVVLPDTKTTTKSSFKYKINKDGIYTFTFIPKKGENVTINVPVVKNSWSL